MEKPLKTQILEKILEAKDTYEKYTTLFNEFKSQTNISRVDKMKASAIGAKISYSFIQIDSLANLYYSLFKETVDSLLSDSINNERKILQETINAYNIENGDVKFPEEINNFLQELEKNGN